MKKDVTDIVKYGENDGEWCPLYECICGYSEQFISLSIYEDEPDECPKCGRKYFFSYIYQLVEKKEV